MAQHTVRVWDLPTRVFHWALVAGIVGLVASAEVGGNAMVWHFRFGYAVLSLLLFRFVWGLVGGHWSRFSTFIPSPTRLFRYLRGQGDTVDTVGHNPLGALSVVGMLLVLLLHAGFGLASDDEIAASGPLVSKIPADWVSFATFVHTEVSKVVLIGLIGLHLAAIAWYRLRKRVNLVGPMLSGDKQLEMDVPASRDDLSSRVFALVVFLVCVASVYGALQWVS
jgi:cytochrome b